MPITFRGDQGFPYCSLFRLVVPRTALSTTSPSVATSARPELGHAHYYRIGLMCRPITAGSSRAGSDVASLPVQKLSGIEITVVAYGPAVKRGITAGPWIKPAVMPYPS